MTYLAWTSTSSPKRIFVDTEEAALESFQRGTNFPSNEHIFVVDEEHVSEYRYGLEKA